MQEGASTSIEGFLFPGELLGLLSRLIFLLDATFFKMSFVASIRCYICCASY